MIDVRDASKRFVIHHQRATQLKERIVGRLKGRRFESEEFWALQHVTLSIREGESVAFIGANGSGKSTLLQLIARILVPDGGNVRVTGRVAALLELGAGFNPDLTGRENVYLASAILGFSRKEIEARMADIIDFSELERFIDTPIKNYSTGMYMRLGFSVATHVDPDILLIDEILAVGDEAFQAKCIRRIEDFRRRGKTIVFVSHSMDAVRRICGRAVLLDNGRLALDSSPDEVIRHYYGILGIGSGASSAAEETPPAPGMSATEPAPTPLAVPSAPAMPEGPVFLEFCEWLGADGVPIPGPVNVRGVLARVTAAPAAPQAASAEPAPLPVLPPMPPLSNRHGIGLLRVRDVEIEGAAAGMAPVPGGPLAVRIRYEAECIIKRPVIGVAIHDQGGSFLLGPNTRAQGMTIASIEGRGTVEWLVPSLPLQPGTYHLTVAFFNHALDVVYDYCDRMFAFSVAGPEPDVPGALSVPSQFRPPVKEDLPERAKESSDEAESSTAEETTVPAMAAAESPPA